MADSNTTETKSRRGWMLGKSKAKSPADEKKSDPPTMLQFLDSREDTDNVEESPKKGVLPRRKKGKSTDESTVFSSRTSFSFILKDDRQHKAVYRHFGPGDNIQVELGHSKPEPISEYHVVIKVQASTVTLNDCLTRRGYSFDLIDPPCLPATPGTDVIGTVEICGAKVEGFEQGDRVAALLKSGANARYAQAHHADLVKVPKTLDSGEAVCMVSIYATAYKALRIVSHKNTTFSMKKKKVLVVNGLDPIGQALIQMCNKGGAEVYATAPDNRHGYVRSVLNAIPLPVAAAEWRNFADDIDVVFDGVCEDGLESAKKVINPEGKIVCFGHSWMLRETMGAFGAPLSAYWRKFQSQLNSHQVDIHQTSIEEKDEYKKILEALFGLLKNNKVKPAISKRISLAEVGQCHKKIESDSSRGMIVCLPWKRLKKNKVVESDE